MTDRGREVLRDDEVKSHSGVAHCAFSIARSLYAFPTLPSGLRRLAPQLSFPWQCLYFFPLPHGHGSFLPIFGPTFTGACFSATAAPPPPGSNLSRSLAPYSCPARSTSSLLARNLLRSVFSW